MMFTVKKIFILMITCLFLSSMTVLAAYTPSVPTDWGDFAEKTSVTKEIVGGTEYSFSVLSEKHTFKVEMTQSKGSCYPNPNYQPGMNTPEICTPAPQDQDLSILVDNQDIGSGTNSKTVTSVIKSASLSFAVTASGSGKGSVVINTNGVTKEAIVSPVKSEELTTTTTVKAYVLAPGGVAQFSMKGLGGGVDTVPFTLVYEGTGGAEVISHTFNLALGYYSNQAEINSAKANTAKIHSVKVGYAPSQGFISDNFGNKYFINLQVKKYETINGFKVVTIEVSGGQSGIIPVVQSTVLTGLDFSTSSVSTQILMGNSKVKTTWYGPLMVGSQKYYFRQEYSSSPSQVVLRYISNPFVGNGDVSTSPIAITIPVPSLIDRTTVGTTSLGKATSFPLLNEKSVSSKVYFVPTAFEPEATSGKGSIQFFIGGETAYKKTFPILLSVGAPALSLPAGTGLPDQQLPAGTGTQPTGGSGECKGKTNGEIVEHTLTGPSSAISLKQYSLCVNGVPTVCSPDSVGFVKSIDVSTATQSRKIDLRCAVVGPDLDKFAVGSYYGWLECSVESTFNIVPNENFADVVLGGTNVGAGLYSKNYYCSVLTGTNVPGVLSPITEAWYICPASAKLSGSDGVTTATEVNGYVCYNDEWTLKSNVPLEGDLNADGLVNKDDITWIKKNPKLMWEKILMRDMSKLNALISAMIKNWS